MFEQVRINGSYYYDGAIERLEKLSVGEPVLLMRDHDNEHDANAIRVLDKSGGMLGHVAAGNGNNIILAQLMDAGQNVKAEVSQKSTASTYINVFTADEDDEEEEYDEAQDDEELIRLVQIPIIEEQLRTLGGEIDIKVRDALGLVCNEQTVKTIKEVRASLNKEFELFEDKRKAIKLAIMEPYEAFEDVYKEHVATKYKEADNVLRDRINVVEGDIKKRKEDDIREYFAELALSLKIDFIRFEDMKLKVNLSDSVKKLKEKAEAFLTKISEDVKMIASLDEELRSDVMVEFKQNGFNASNAAITVMERNRRKREEAEAIRKANEQREIERQRAEAARQAAGVKAPEVINTPKVQPKTEAQAEERKFALSFKVIGTKAQLMELKTFLTAGGYIYESIK